MFLRVIFPIWICLSLWYSFTLFFHFLPQGGMDLIKAGAGIMVNMSGLFIWCLYINTKYEKELFKLKEDNMLSFLEEQQKFIGVQLSVIKSEWERLKACEKSLGENERT